MWATMLMIGVKRPEPSADPFFHANVFEQFLVSESRQAHLMRQIGWRGVGPLIWPSPEIDLQHSDRVLGCPRQFSIPRCRLRTGNTTGSTRLGVSEIAADKNPDMDGIYSLWAGFATEEQGVTSWATSGRRDVNSPYGIRSLARMRDVQFVGHITLPMAGADLDLVNYGFPRLRIRYLTTPPAL